MKLPPNINVHQSLHGYEDGHRLIASSKKLSAIDEKLLLIMSDASNPQKAIPESGYLTGIPLLTSGCYALSRTWSALEMPRPGCVWTHTLLIDFTDLAAINFPKTLLRAFSRPSLSDRTTYNSCLCIPLQDQRTLFSNQMKAMATRVLSLIYEKPTDEIVIYEPASDNCDLVILEIWCQQWPRLRRNFRFCTASSPEKSIADVKFDVQVYNDVLTPMDSSQPTTSAQWLRLAIEDLFNHNVEFREYLNYCGADTDHGRKAFLPLCDIYVNSKSDSPTTVEKSISIYNVEFSGQSSYLKYFVASKLLPFLSTISVESYKFCIEHLKFFNENDYKFDTFELLRTIYANDREVLSSEFKYKSAIKSVVERQIISWSVDRILLLINVSPEFLRIVMTKHPQLLACSKFWETIDFPDTAISIAGQLLDSTDVVRAMILSHRQYLASDFPQSRLGSRLILNILNEMSCHRLDAVLTEWLVTATKSVEEMTVFLEQTTQINSNFLSWISKALPPGELGNLGAHDQMWTAYVRSNIDEHTDLHLSAWIFSRAFEIKSEDHGAIIGEFFNPLYSALENKNSPPEWWFLLNKSLPIFNWIPYWDSCYRLRNAVVELFISENIDVSYFLRLGDTLECFSLIVQIASWSDVGKTYLRIAHQKCGNTRRGKIIERFLADRSWFF